MPVTNGETRFRMLQVIREYADEKLEAGPDSAAVRRRQAREVLALAEAAGPELRSASLRTWQERLRIEQENTRIAFRWALEGGDVEIGLRIAGSIWDYWHYWAELREGIRWLEALLALPAADQAPAHARAQALRGLAGLLYWQGEEKRASVLYQEALAIYRDSGDERLQAATLYDAAWAAIGRGDGGEATELAEQSRDLFVQAGDESSAAIVRAWLRSAPVIMGTGGDLEDAADATQDAIDIHRRLGRAHEVADWLEARALLYRVAGDFRRAEEAGLESLRQWNELGTIGRLPLGLKILAAVELGLGHPERAVRLGAAAERWNEEIGGELSEVIANLGNPTQDTRPLLGEAEFARAMEDGRTLPLEEQVSYALGE